MKKQLLVEVLFRMSVQVPIADHNRTRPPFDAHSTTFTKIPLGFLIILYSKADLCNQTED